MVAGILKPQDSPKESDVGDDMIKNPSIKGLIDRLIAKTQDGSITWDVVEDNRWSYEHNEFQYVVSTHHGKYGILVFGQKDEYGYTDYKALNNDYKDGKEVFRLCKVLVDMYPQENSRSALLNTAFHALDETV